MKPRPVLERRTILFTRRCSERRLFLLPDREEVANTYWYCLGWAADKHGIELHAAVAMTNHTHVVATDWKGTYPHFLRDFHGLLARAVNRLRGRWEHFWDSKQASVVLLADAPAQRDKLIYVLTNPVGTVAKASEWTGASALSSILEGAPITATRPEGFFDAHGKMPPSITIKFTAPPTLAHMSEGEYVALVRDTVTAVERQRARQRRKKGHHVVGMGRVLQQRWGDRPRDWEPRRQLNPMLACRDPRLRAEELARIRYFRGAHHDAFELNRAGVPAVFPAGTWLMRFRASIQISTA